MAKHPRLSEEDQRKAVIDAARCVSSRRHMLEPIPPPMGAPRPEFGSFLFQRCVQCGTVTRDKVSRLTGDRLSPREYDRPVWYQQALEEGQDPSWWRATYWDTLGPEFFLEPEVVVPIRRKRRAS